MSCRAELYVLHPNFVYVTYIRTRGKRRLLSVFIPLPRMVFVFSRSCIHFKTISMYAKVYFLFVSVRLWSCEGKTESPATVAPQENKLRKNLQSNFVQTLERYNKVADTKTCEGDCSDHWGKKFFHNTYVRRAFEVFESFTSKAAGFVFQSVLVSCQANPSQRTVHCRHRNACASLHNGTCRSYWHRGCMSKAKANSSYSDTNICSWFLRILSEQTARIWLSLTHARTALIIESK